MSYRINFAGPFLLAPAQSGARVLSHQSGLLMLKYVAIIHERVVTRGRLIPTNSSSIYDTTRISAAVAARLGWGNSRRKGEITGLTLERREVQSAA
jgi:hypothetical protein